MQHCYYLQIIIIKIKATILKTEVKNVFSSIIFMNI